MYTKLESTKRTCQLRIEFHKATPIIIKIISLSQKHLQSSSFKRNSPKKSSFKRKTFENMVIWREIQFLRNTIYFDLDDATSNKSPSIKVVFLFIIEQKQRFIKKIKKIEQKQGVKAKGLPLMPPFFSFSSCFR